jgi:alpha-tubulin suppressor-like RCC1 family protein
MSSFLTIPLSEIKKFLRYYNLPIPSDQEAAYGLVWEYLIENEGLMIPSVYLEDFVLAYNHQDKIENIQKISTSSILTRSDQELLGLFPSWDLTAINRERTIRILGYLDLLDNDLSVFDNLPFDVLSTIGRYLDTRTLLWYTRISRRMASLFIESQQLLEIMRIKLQPKVRVDLSLVSKEELGYWLKRENSIPIAAGGDHSLFLNSQGQVLSCGSNKQGQSGQPGWDIESEPTIIQDPEDELGKVVAIAAGAEHSLFLVGYSTAISPPEPAVLNSRGEVWACGRGGTELYFLIECIDFTTTKITAISTGETYSLFLDSNGRVLVADNETIFSRENDYDEDEEPEPHFISPLENFEDIVAVSAGDKYNLLLSAQGQVYDLGSDGITPTLITGLGDSPIISLSSGGKHALILNAKGQVYILGSTYYAQAEMIGLITPILIDQGISEISIVAVAAGEKHSLLLNAEGQVFSFGQGYYGQLGLGDRGDRLFPTLIGGLGESPIIAMAAGREHSMLLNSQGRVFTFGEGSYGQLGLGEVGWGNVTIPEMIENLVL